MFWNKKADSSKSDMTKILHIRTLDSLNWHTKDWVGIFLVDLTYAVKDKLEKARLLTMQKINLNILTLYSDLISYSMRKFIRTFCLKPWQIINKQMKQNKTSLWCLEPNMDKIVIARVKNRQKSLSLCSPTPLYPSNNNNHDEHIERKEIKSFPSP